MDKTWKPLDWFINNAPDGTSKISVLNALKFLKNTTEYSEFIEYASYDNGLIHIDYRFDNGYTMSLMFRTDDLVRVYGRLRRSTDMPVSYDATLHPVAVADFLSLARNDSPSLYD